MFCMRKIKEQGTHIIDFMILEYDRSGSFQGRLDVKLCSSKRWFMANEKYSGYTKIWNCKFSFLY